MKVIELFSVKNYEDWKDKDPHLQDLKESPFNWKYPFFDRLIETFTPLKGNSKGLVHIIRGPRQVGKTTLLKRAMEQIWSADGTRLKTLFIQGDWVNDFKDLDKLLRPYLETKSIELVIIDEVTFIDQWQRSIKGWFDEGLTRKVHFLVTGSNAFDLKKQAELLPGRRGKGQDFELLPLSFREYVETCQHVFKTEDRSKLFENYLITGGLPHAIKEYILDNKTDEAQETYLRWIKGDFLKANKSDGLLKELFQALVQTLNFPTGLDDLRKRSSMNSHNTVKDYISFSKSAFVLSEFSRINSNDWTFFPRKNKKYYFRDPLIFRLAMNWANVEVLPEHQRGYLFEMCMAEHFYRKQKRIGYYQDNKQNEVDFLGKEIAMEVKSGNKLSDLGLIKKIVHNNKVVTSANKDHKKIETIRCIPIWDFLMD